MKAQAIIHVESITLPAGQCVVDEPGGPACPYWIDLTDQGSVTEARCGHRYIMGRPNRMIPGYINRPGWCPMGSGAVVWATTGVLSDGGKS